MIFYALIFEEIPNNRHMHQSSVLSIIKKVITKSIKLWWLHEVTFIRKYLKDGLKSFVYTYVYKFYFDYTEIPGSLNFWELFLILMVYYGIMEDTVKITEKQNLMKD